MTSAAPTILALETDSAWVVILAVSLVTLVAAWLLRRLIRRPGGVASGLLLASPLVLPLIAALVYEQAVLPEIRVMSPASEALFQRSSELMHFLLLSDGQGTTIPYELSGSVGPWLLLFGIAFSSFMLIRRVVGIALLHRLVRRCRPPEDKLHEELVERVRALMGETSLSFAPELLLLPPGVPGAFATGVRRPQILLSEELLEILDDDELDALLAHEIAHIEARDLLVVSTSGFLRDLVAWNPVAHLSLRKLALDRELEADRRAAAMTRRPLAVASGLLKMCELARCCPRMKARPALAFAFFRTTAPLKRRVSSLLALADGVELPRASERMPYVMAALLVAVLGLQAGAHITRANQSALAIVVGESNARPWTPPHSLRSDEGRPQARPRTSPLERPTDLSRPLRSQAFLEAAVLEKDLGRWLLWMKKQAASRLGVRAATLRWQARDAWQAIPTSLQIGMGLPVVIYRLEMTDLRERRVR